MSDRQLRKEIAELREQVRRRDEALDTILDKIKDYEHSVYLLNSILAAIREAREGNDGNS